MFTKEKYIERIVKKHIKEDKEQFKFTEEIKTHEFKNKKNCFIAIILQESKNAIVTYVPKKVTIFNIGSHTYLNLAQGKYLNNKTHVSVYLEGVMLPVEHSFIQYETVYTLYYDQNGNPTNNIEEIPQSEMKYLLRDHKGNFVTNEEGYFCISVNENIKGFEFDSQTANVLFESNLTQDMSMDKPNKTLPILTVVTFVNLLLLFIILGVTIYPMVG